MDNSYSDRGPRQKRPRLTHSAVGAITSSSHQQPQPETSIADASLFFPVHLHIIPEDQPHGTLQNSDSNLPGSHVHDDSTTINSPSPDTPDGAFPEDPLLSLYEVGMTRITALTGSHLTPDTAAGLKAVLSTVHNHLSAVHPHPLVIRLSSSHVSDDEFRDMANIVSSGLYSFSARGGSLSGSSRAAVPSPTATPSESSASAGKTKSVSSSRNRKIHKLCAERDRRVCCLTTLGSDGVVSHILPFSLKDEKAVSFWKFVSLFCGEAEMIALRAATCPSGTDNLTNVWWLAKTPHGLFDLGYVVVIPQLSPEHMPYDPSTVSEYVAVVEYPAGRAKARLVIDDGVNLRRLLPGDTVRFRTTDPSRLPLPHPLLFQLHAIISRIMVAKAASGFPVLTGDDGDSELSDLSLADEDGTECVLTGEPWHDEEPREDLVMDPTGRSVGFKVDHQAPYLRPPPRPTSSDSGSYSPSAHHSHSEDRPCSTGSHLVASEESATVQEYAKEQPRSITVIESEYQLRMNEKYQLMVEILGREKGVKRKWWEG